MKEQQIRIEEINNKLGVKLVNDGYGLELFTMRNGYQWTGSGVNDEIIGMIINVLSEYQTLTAIDKTREALT